MRQLFWVLCLLVWLPVLWATPQKTRLSLLDRSIAAAYVGFQKCEALHMKCAIAMVNSYGSPIVTMQMPQVLPLYPSLAYSEAFTSGTMGASTDELRAFSQAHKPLHGIQGFGYWGKQILLSSGGFILIGNHNQLIGGVGVSSNKQGMDYSTWSAKNDLVGKTVYTAFNHLKNTTQLPKLVKDYLNLKYPQHPKLTQIFNAALYHGKEYCKKLNIACVVVISNVHGDNFFMMDMGRDDIHAQVPFTKMVALTSAATGVPSGKLKDRSPLDGISSGIFGYHYGLGYLMGVSGGYPILYHGKVIGGLGVGTTPLANVKADYRGYSEKISQVILTYINQALDHFKPKTDVEW